MMCKIIDETPFGLGAFIARAVCIPGRLGAGWRTYTTQIRARAVYFFGVGHYRIAGVGVTCATY